jgi:hypothetical protein
MSDFVEKFLVSVIGLMLILTTLVCVVVMR